MLTCFLLVNNYISIVKKVNLHFDTAELVILLNRNLFGNTTIQPHVILFFQRALAI